VNYVFTLLFDAGVLVGTVYLIDQRGWSAWWFLLAVALISFSAPPRAKGKS